MPNSLVLIQARMASTRLPGKVMMDLCGKPVLQHVVERCREADVGPVVVATGYPTEPNRPIIEWCRDNDVFCCAPKVDEGNVHGRFAQCLSLSRWQRPSTWLRVTADCPLVEPTFLRTLAEQMEQNPHAYYADLTYMRSGVPVGLGAQAYRTQAFLDVDQATLTDHEREHLSVFHRSEFAHRCIWPEVSEDWHRPYRLTLDTAEDLAWLRFLVRQCGTDNRRVLRFLDHQALGAQSVKWAKAQKTCWLGYDTQEVQNAGVLRSRR